MILAPSLSQGTYRVVRLRYAGPPAEPGGPAQWAEIGPEPRFTRLDWPTAAAAFTRLVNLEAAPPGKRPGNVPVPAAASLVFRCLIGGWPQTGCWTRPVIVTAPYSMIVRGVVCVRCFRASRGGPVPPEARCAQGAPYVWAGRGPHISLVTVLLLVGRRHEVDSVTLLDQECWAASTGTAAT